MVLQGTPQTDAVRLTELFTNACVVVLQVCKRLREWMLQVRKRFHGCVFEGSQGGWQMDIIMCTGMLTQMNVVGSQGASKTGAINLTGTLINEYQEGSQRST